MGNKGNLPKAGHPAADFHGAWSAVYLKWDNRQTGQNMDLMKCLCYHMGMDNRNQNQASNEIQFDSKQIPENQSKRNNDIKFHTRLTFKDRLRKFLHKPLMHGPRKFLWLAAALIVIAGIIVGIVMVVNLNTNRLEEGSDEWYSELDDEIQDGFANNDFELSLKKINTAIDNAKEKSDKETVRRLYTEKAFIYTNSSMHKEAIATYTEMLEYFGNETNIYSSLANSQLAIGDKKSALENYRNAVKYAQDESDMGFMQSMVEQLEVEVATEE